MEIAGYSYLGIFICMEIAAFVIAIVGVVHTRDIGGRLAGLSYGLSSIVIAATPPIVVWRVHPGLSWWHAPLIAPLILGCLAILYGFRKSRPTA